MVKISRRNMLKSGAALAAGTAAMGSGVRHADAADRAGAKYNWGHTMDFGEQYYVRILEILENIRRNEMQLVGDISGRMADTIKKGGRVWYDAYVGHMGNIECLEENKGNPRIFTSNPDKVKHDRMKPGDVYDRRA